MTTRRTTFSKFIIEDERRRVSPDPELTALLNDIQTGCKFIASAVSRGGLDSAAPNAMRALAQEIMLHECEWGAKLCATTNDGVERSDLIHSAYPRGRYLLLFDALDGAQQLDVNVPVGTIFSVLRAPERDETPTAADFLRPGTDQIAAGFALYGPASTIVLTLGAGTHGFTLDREIGAYTLTHPEMKIPDDTCDFAIDASNERFWEPPVRHYVDECVQGEAGARGADFHMRWVDSLVGEVHRILIRGGVFIYPRGTKDSQSPSNPRLVFDANPMAMIVEHAGGAASTGRERILDVVPASEGQRVPVILGSRREVDRIVRYHEDYDRGEDLAFETPLFNTRSLFRTV